MKTATLLALGSLAALALLAPMASATPTCVDPEASQEPIFEVDNHTCVDLEGEHIVYGGTRGHVGPKPLINQYYVG